MNAPTQITMDPETAQRAKAKAEALGISLVEYVQRVVASDLGEDSRTVRRSGKADISLVFNLNASDKAQPKAHVSEIFDLVKDGPETDIARDKDKLIGEAVWDDYLRSVGRRPRNKPGRG